MLRALTYSNAGSVIVRVAQLVVSAEIVFSTQAGKVRHRLLSW